MDKKKTFETYLTWLGLSKLVSKTGFYFSMAIAIAVTPVLSPFIVGAQEEDPKAPIIEELEEEEAESEVAVEPEPAYSGGEDMVGVEPPPPNPEVPCGENAIINGDFEEPIVTPPYSWDIYPSGTVGLGWTVNWVPSVPFIYQGTKRPSPQLELQANVQDWYAQSGDQYTELDTDWTGPGGSLNGEPASVEIFQILTTTPGETYDISFHFSPRPGIDASNNILEFSWDGVVIETISEAGGSNVNWTKYSYSLEATSGLTTIQFADRGIPNSLGTFLDNVTVSENCPEPCEVGTLWQIGDEEADIADNPSDELNWDAPYEFGVFPPFVDPFVVGSTPDEEFPWNSAADEPYATDFDIDFNYSSDEIAGARLTLSWSPGQTGDNNPETKEVWLDGSKIGEVTRVGYPAPGWFRDREVFQDTFDFTLTPGPHTLNLKHLTGDGTFWDYVRLEVTYCGDEPPPPPCEPGDQWADNVIDENQGNTKGGGSVSPDRSDPESVLDEPDGAFFSLGQGGSLTVSFDKYIVDVEGDDLSFHEVTYGRDSYPEETIMVEVSQDGVVWHEIGSVSNHAPADGVGYLDFSSTGLSWIQYVRITDTTDFGPHAEGADGYDIDAIDATYGSCNYGTLEKTGEYDYETGLITYTIIGSLFGEGIAYDIVITDELPEGTEFVSANYSGTEDSGIVTWNMGDIAAPASGAFILEVIVNPLSGTDPWADVMVSFSQGLRQDGTPVVLERSDPNQALGEAERTDVVNFVSLGFGGELVLEFDEPFFNGTGADIEIVETSFGDPSESSYPETVEVYASQNGTDWTFLTNAILDEMVDLGPLLWAKYIKLVDISNPDDFPASADGYDVDGVRTLYPVPNICEIENTVYGEYQTEDNGGGETIWDVSTTVTTVNPIACEEPEEPPEEDEGYATGIKFNDHNSNGQKDTEDEGLSGWTIFAGRLVEELEVDANGPETGTPITSTTTLTAGQKYFMRISDTFFAGDSITADAKYSVQEPNTEWTDLVQSYESWGTTLLDLHLDGVAPFWGEYNENHVYWQTVMGADTQITFQIYDIFASNNSGTLKVEIYEVIAEDITNGDGNYYFDLSGITGDIVIAEQIKEGWLQTAPSPDGFYMVSADDDNEGLDFGNHFIEEEDEGGDDDDDGDGGGGGGGSGGGGGGGSHPADPDDDDEEVAGDQDEGNGEEEEDAGGIGGGDDEGAILGDQEEGEVLAAAGSSTLITLLLVILASLLLTTAIYPLRKTK